MVSKPLAVPNNDDIDSGPEKFIIEEQIKRPNLGQKNIDSKIEEGLSNKYKLNEDIIKKANEMGQLSKQEEKAGDYAAEVRKLITEKVDELRKDVDAKISENEIEIERNIQNIKEQYIPPSKKK